MSNETSNSEEVKKKYGIELDDTVVYEGNERKVKEIRGWGDREEVVLWTDEDRGLEAEIVSIDELDDY